MEIAKKEKRLATPESSKGLGREPIQDLHEWLARGVHTRASCWEERTTSDFADAEEEPLRRVVSH